MIKLYKKKVITSLREPKNKTPEKRYRNIEEDLGKTPPKATVTYKALEPLEESPDVALKLEGDELIL